MYTRGHKMGYWVKAGIFFVKVNFNFFYKPIVRQILLQFKQLLPHWIYSIFSVLPIIFMYPSDSLKLQIQHRSNEPSTSKWSKLHIMIIRYKMNECWKERVEGWIWITIWGKDNPVLTRLLTTPPVFPSVSFETFFPVFSSSTFATTEISCNKQHWDHCQKQL